MGSLASIPRAKEWKQPKPGNNEIVGFLAGGRRNTREGMKTEFLKRYGIRIQNHIGHEQNADRNTFIPSQTEVVFIVGDDIEPGQLQRVLRCSAVLGLTPIGIDRKKEKLWDAILAAEGYSNPPKWRDGSLIENPADPAKLESERKAELAELEKPRMAYVDPKLASSAPKLAAVVTPKLVEDVLNQYKPGGTKSLKGPVKAAVKRGSKGRPGERSESAGSTPFGAAIIAAREARNWTQGEAARRADVSQGNLSSWERGASIPLYGLYLKLTKVLPGLPEPEGMLGKKAFLARGGTVLHRGGKEESLAPAAPKTAAEAFSPRPAPATPPVPPPPAPPKEDPAVFAARVIAAMPVPTPAASDEDLLTINLRSGGTLTVRATVNMFKLRGEDRAFVNAVIDMLQAYEEKKE